MEAWKTCEGWKLSLRGEQLERFLGQLLDANLLEPLAHALGAAFRASLSGEAFLAGLSSLESLLDTRELVAHWVWQHRWNSWRRWSCRLGGRWRQSFLLEFLDENVDPLVDHLDAKRHGNLVAASSQISLDPLEDPDSAAPGIDLAHLVAWLDVLDEILEANVDENLLGPG